MKKILIYTLAALTALTGVSCVRENAVVDIPSGDTVNEIVLGIRCDAPSLMTKADDDAAGVDDYNENAVYWIDYFVYDDPSGEAVLHDRISYATKDGGMIKPVTQTVIDANTRTINLDALVNAGHFTDLTGSVYVVANLPETFTHDGIEGIKQGAEVIGTTLEALQKLAVTSAFVDSDSDALAGRVLTDHHFVMVTPSPVEFTLQERTSVLVSATLDRVAAKVRVDLNIADYVIETKTLSAGGTVQYVWTPQYDKVQIYMLWIDKVGTLDGTPERYTDSGDGANAGNFFNTPRYAMNYRGTTRGAAGGTVNDALIGDVDNTQKDIAKYVLKYVGVKDGVRGYYDKDDEDGVAYIHIDADDNEITPPGNSEGSVGILREYVNEPIKRSFYPVQSVPMYTYPIKWANRDAHAPFIKVILPWDKYEYNVANADNKFRGSLISSGVENYYKVLVPKIQYPDVTDPVYELRSNYFVDISLDLSVLGSEADEVPVDVFGTYHVVGWNDPVHKGGDVQAGKYLSVSSTSYEMYGNTLEIPVVSSNELEIVDVTAKYTTFNPAGTANLAKSEYSITSPDRTKVVVSHEVESELDNLRPQDISPITYTFVIQHSGDKSYTTNTITVTQYPSLYISSRTNSNWTTTGNQYNSAYGYVYINNAQTRTRTENDSVEDSPYNWRYIIGITNRTGSNSNPNTYLITTKTIDPSLGFVLGDTRESAINNLVESNSTKFSNAPALFGDSPRKLSYYYPTDETDRTEVMVAPSFRIASSYGKVGYALYRNDARLRCAAYQEDGYPAGRWRLPTKAELQYITTLSAAGLIPQLFNDLATSDTSIYMSAHGVITIDHGVVKDTTSDYGFVRCVYDEWYWGEERVNNTTFTWGDKAR